MKKYLLLFSFLLQISDLFAADTCRVKVNLTEVKDDRVYVRVYAPAITTSTIEYIMPAVIPGSYARKDFGRFVKEIKAYSKSGKKLKIKKSSTNVFVISKAQTLDYIEYWVDDTWDAPDENYIFQPGGTNIESGTNFVVNHQGFYGYFEGFKMIPYSIEYTREQNHYAFTPLEIKRGSYTDVAFAPSYVKLVDNPIMFCEPDTTSFKVANMTVHIGVYSATGKVRSGNVEKTVEPLAKALKNFFGKLPVNDYYFILYFPKYAKEGITSYGGFGALEHSYCSFYFLPEIPDKEQLNDVMQSVAGHEFLHILTPLNIHSEEIEFFDFRNPKMSQHLWMYEGVTEYFANLVRLRAKLIDEKAFISEIISKIKTAAGYPNVSFTEMSRNILTDQYKEMYNNVYYKGALIGFLLDIRLHQLSNDSMGLRELMLMLSDKYGPSKPFKDDELIPEIVRMTYPEIESFFKDFVIGNIPLPLKKYFALVGWEYYNDEEVEFYSFGAVHFITNKKSQQVIAVGTEEAKNSLKLRTNDILISINGNPVDVTSDSLIDLIEAPLHNQRVTATVKRGNEELTFTASPVIQKQKKQYFIRKSAVMTPEQIRMRKSLLGL